MENENSMSEPTKELVLDLDRLVGENEEKLQYELAKIEQTLKKESKIYTNLPIKVLSILGGLLSALFFIGFLGIAGIFGSGSAMVVLGLAVVIISIMINNAKDTTILDTMSISGLVIGGTLLCLGFIEANDSAVSACLVLMILSLIIISFCKGYIIHFLSILTFHLSFLWIFILNDAGDLVHVYTAYLVGTLLTVFLFESTFVTSSKKLNTLYKPLLTGTVFAFCVLLICLGHKKTIDFTITHDWISMSIISMGLLAIVVHIIKPFGWSLVKKLGVVLGLFVMLAPTYYFPSIAGTLLILLCAYHTSQRTSLVVGVAGLVYFTSLYYYDLKYTLLTKSIVLMVMGALFLIAYAVVYKRIKSR